MGPSLTVYSLNWGAKSCLYETTCISCSEILVILFVWIAKVRPMLQALWFKGMDSTLFKPYFCHFLTMKLKSNNLIFQCLNWVPLIYKMGMILLTAGCGGSCQLLGRWRQKNLKFSLAWPKVGKSCLKNKNKRTRDIAQVVKYFPSKQEALGSISSTKIYIYIYIYIYICIYIYI
jgi:hypothetical protein